MKKDPWIGLCDKCTTSDCCAKFLTPSITNKELKSIEFLTGFSNIANSFTVNDLHVYSLKAKPGTKNECIFLDSDKKCTIHSFRPFDCRIFPFDIYKIDGEFTWVIYTCNSEISWKWSDEILTSFEKNLFSEDILKHLDMFTDLARVEEGKIYPHQILRKVNFGISNKEKN